MHARQRLLRRRPRVSDQGQCATCVNAAITSAVEAASSCELGVAGSSIVLSRVFSYYCKPPLKRSCGTGWAFDQALQALNDSDVGESVPQANCTAGYDLEQIRTVSSGQLQAACRAVLDRCPRSSLLRSCRPSALTSFWEIQRAIRTQGTVLTR